MGSSRMALEMTGHEGFLGESQGLSDNGWVKPIHFLTHSTHWTKGPLDSLKPPVASLLLFPVIRDDKAYPPSEGVPNPAHLSFLGELQVDKAGTPSEHSPRPHCTASNNEGGDRCWITRTMSSQSPHCASVKRTPPGMSK